MSKLTGADGAPAVGIIMGSNSDLKTMAPATQVLGELGVSYEKQVVSAHRTPKHMFDYADRVEERGLSIIIAGAGGAAHLPGMVASKTLLPVIGVPVVATPLRGLDALLSIMQMPAEVGVATMSVGTIGAQNAGYFAAAILALKDPALHTKLRAIRGIPDGTTSLPVNSKKVYIVAEYDSDTQALRHAEEYLAKLHVPYERRILGCAGESEGLAKQVAELEASGAAVFIAGSACGIGFACNVARTTTLPVLGVPILSTQVDCLDEFLRSFLDMPPGVATFAVGRPGAINAALFAATIISKPGSETWENLQQMRKEQTERVLAMTV